MLVTTDELSTERDVAGGTPGAGTDLNTGVVRPHFTTLGFYSTLSIRRLADHTGAAYTAHTYNLPLEHLLTGGPTAALHHTYQLSPDDLLTGGPPTAGLLPRHQRLTRDGAGMAQVDAASQG